MKTATKMFMLMLVMIFFTGQAFSQATATTTTKEVKKENTVTSNQGKFVDENKNGVCDNYEARHKDGKNCPQYDNCCKGKANADCSGKGSANCCGKASATCGGKGSATCTGMKSANCQGPCKGQSKCPNKSSSPTPVPDKGENK